MAQIAPRACQWFGVAKVTMSIDLSSKILRMSWTTTGSWPLFLPTPFDAEPARDLSASQTVRMSQPWLPLNAPRWLPPRPPVPMPATRRVSPRLLRLAGFGSSAQSGVPRRAAIAAEIKAEWEIKDRRSSMERPFARREIGGERGEKSNPPVRLDQR